MEICSHPHLLKPPLTMGKETAHFTQEESDAEAPRRQDIIKRVLTDALLN